MSKQVITLPLETYGMDDLSAALTPEKVVVQFSAATVAAVESFTQMLNGDKRIKSVSIDLGADGFEAAFINEDGDDTGLDGVLDLELFLDASNEGSHIRLVLSGCDTDIEDDQGDTCCVTGEFFANIPVAAMRDQLQAR